MKIAIVGYGRMGHMIEHIAVERGHEVVLTVNSADHDARTTALLQQADVAIEFSRPAAAVDNYRWCLDHGVPVVSGTTGWLDRWDEVTEYVRTCRGAFFYASNFSVGVNIFFRLNRRLAQVMASFGDYHASLEETHHIHKLDAPSGTAITLAEGIVENHPAYGSWALDEGQALAGDVLPVTARREGEVPGIHEVTYRSAVDEISIRHSAFSREGFARGAVMAAEYLQGRKGIYGMDDLLAGKLTF